MPFIDLEAAKREVLHEDDTYTFRFAGGQEHTFPASLPAAVEVEQLLVQEEADKRGGATSLGDTERLMRVAYGGTAYDDLRAAGVQFTDLARAYGVVSTAWVEGFSDPSTSQRILAWARKGATPSSGSSNGGAPSRPTSNGSTGSMLGGPSTVADLVPGGSVRSSRGSPRRP
jgi:hypothetical protein